MLRKKYRAVLVVEDEVRVKFQRLLAKKVSEIQREGYMVDIQYSTTDNIFSALISAYEYIL